MFRKTIFWFHLVAGITTGLVVVMMSVTGVILTYERQMIVWSDRAYYQEPAAGERRRSIDELVAAASRADFQPGSITTFSDSSAPVSVNAVRGQGSVYMSPYSGAILGAPKQGLREFFSTVTGWHRWFNATGDQRTVARAITGISNLAFLLLICTGSYLWLPKVFRWALFRARLFFENRTGTSKERDFNWHHVYGIWSAVPLFIVVATAVVFSYPWANDLVYRSVGETVPAGGMGMGMGMGMGAVSPSASPGPALSVGASGAQGEDNRLLLEPLFAKAAGQLEDWQSIVVQLPRNDAQSVSFTIDRGDGGQPQKRHSLVLNAKTGAVDQWQPFGSLSTGTQARQWIRRLHTGEALGVVGQAIAGIVSFTSLIMVWTGFALAYRRLIVPLLRKRAR